MTDRPNTRRLVILVLLTVLGATGCELTPQDWGPVTSTYNGKVRVEGSGTFFNEDQVSAVNRMRIKDRDNDGNTVYGRTSFNVWKFDPYAGGSGQFRWVSDQVKSTPEFANAERTYLLSTSLDSQGSRYRGHSEACAQMGWPVPDSCSSAFPTFDY